MPAKHFQTIWPSYLLLAASLAVSVSSAVYVRQSIDRVEDHRFQGAALLLQQNLNSEFERYTDVLFAARSYMNSASSVPRARWTEFVSSLNLPDHYRGMLSLGFAPYIPSDPPVLLDEFVNGVRREGFSHFAIHPAGTRPFYAPVDYVEPFGVNEAAFGFDMASDPDRRAAMEEAADENQPVATRKVHLVQDSPEESRPGFLIYVPIYRPDVQLTTSKDRRDGLLGFVFSTYRVPTLLNSILLKDQSFRSVSFALYDGSPGDDHLLFATPEFQAATSQPRGDSTPLMQATLPLTIASRTWTLVVRPSRHFADSMDHNLPWLILLGGALVSWLLFGVSWLQIRARAQSELAAAKLAESETLLRESELRYRLKIEQSPLAVQTLAPDGTTLSVNSAWQELWGLTLEDLRGYNFLHDSEFERAGVKQLIRDAFAGNSVSLGTFYYDSLPLPSGARPRPRWVRSFLYPVKDLHGQIKELVLIHQDVTDRKRAEEELRRAKEQAEAANHAKDQFLAVLSHELRNPLSPVLSMVNLLQEPAVSPEEAREALEVIRRNVELEARLIDDLLDVTRIARGKLHLDLETVNAHTTLQHALQICNSEIAAKHLRIELHLRAKQHLLNADPARLQQVCWNLIKNAVKFTPEGGLITISTANESNNVDGGSLVISVSDTGIGVEPDKLPRIFDAFEQADRSITRRFGGLGLGLAITKALVEAHRGSITAASKGINRGTTFSVRFPLPSPQQLAASPVAPAGQSLPAEGAGRRPHPLHILIIEDQPDARRGLHVILQHHGYEVRDAATGAEALEALRGWPCDLIISDIGLPDLSGFDLLPKLREIRNVPAIALTGFGMEQDVLHAQEAGFNHHLTKPIHFERLEHAIRTLTAGHPAHS